MLTLHYQITLGAIPQKVWKTLFDKSTYSTWTKPFSPDGSESVYEWSWEQGAEIVFTDAERSGGMKAMIAESIPYESLSIEHRAEFYVDKETGEEQVTEYESHGYENYRLTQQWDQTVLEVEMVWIPEEYAEMFNAMRPQALECVKQLCEQ